MNFDFLGSSGSTVLAHLPMYGLLFLIVPLLFLVIMKLLLAMRTGASKKAPAQWILSGQYDDQGRPLLARETAASPEARFRAVLHAGRSRYTR